MKRFFKRILDIVLTTYDYVTLFAWVAWGTHADDLCERDSRGE